MASSHQKATRLRAVARVRSGPAESKTPCTQRNSRRENRETRRRPASSTVGRAENAMSSKSVRNDDGESYCEIVPTKQPNKGDGSRRRL
jgi:hypothetical protein